MIAITTSNSMSVNPFEHFRPAAKAKLFFICKC
jgi:hypothetical protein